MTSDLARELLPRDRPKSGNGRRRPSWDESGGDEFPKVPASVQATSDEEEDTEESDEESQQGRVEDDAEDDYEITEDQRQAMLELELLSSNYSVAVQDKLAQLNAQLARDPSPPAERESRVSFKANLVDLVAPPPDYSTEEEPLPDSDADDEEVEQQDGVTDATEQKSGNTPPSPGTNADPNERFSPPNQPAGRVLVERDGQFILASQTEMEARERRDHEAFSGSSQRGARVNSEYEGRTTENNSPQDDSRETTPRLRINGSGSSSGSRSQSEVDRSSRTVASNSYCSSYKLPALEKPKVQHSRDKAKRETDKRKSREEELMRRQANETAFQAWLRHKREHSAVARQREQETGKQRHQEVTTTEDPFTEWLRTKRTLQHREKDLERQHQEEMDSHARDQCDRAYRSWLRRKNREARIHALEERNQARIARLMMRQNCQAQLTRAMLNAHKLGWNVSCY